MTWRGRRQARGRGIRAHYEFLAAAASADGRKALAMEPRALAERVNRADLFRIPSVSDAQAHLLESAGVDTIKELATRNAASLAAKLKEAGGDAAPDEATVASWVEAAKAMPPMVTH